MRQKEYAWFDINGTLVPHGEKHISRQMADAFGLVPYRGINTRVSVRTIQRYLPTQVTNLPSIVLLGAEIWSAEGKNLHAFSLSYRAKSRLCALLESSAKHIARARYYIAGCGISANFFADREYLTKVQEKMASRGEWAAATLSLPDFLDGLMKEEVSALSLEIASADFSFPSDVPFEVTFDGVREDTREFVITSEGVNKGSSLAFLCRELGVDLSCVITAGDDQPDIPAFQQAYGIAVGEMFPYAQTLVASPDVLAEWLVRNYQR